ncbi:hypothetical protein L6452_38542 [Arctium lappa]|uniref:Uncharacterized protein n=1 Tax=Arctium lappa TaxID=4217 RepID=A0ACB8XQZ7_ARCLA|nr:hypothetical protein L6452_38542 [Arctium lappa]
MEKNGPIGDFRKVFDAGVRVKESSPETKVVGVAGSASEHWQIEDQKTPSAASKSPSVVEETSVSSPEIEEVREAKLGEVENQKVRKVKVGQAAGMGQDQD